MNVTSKGIREKRLEELKNATIAHLTEKNTAMIDYIAMMSDVELPIAAEAQEERIGGMENELV